MLHPLKPGAFFRFMALLFVVSLVPKSAGVSINKLAAWKKDAGSPQIPAGRLPWLHVESSGHYLETEDGRPFFWLGDTAWQLIDATTREECTYYLHARARQGYTVIMTTVLAEFDGVNKPNALGQKPFIDNDPLRPNEAYFNRVVEIVKEAQSIGLYVGLLPTWGDKLTAPWGVGPRVFRKDNLPVARGYARYLGKKLRGYSNVIWILGGDRPPRLAGMRDEYLRNIAKEAGFAADEDWTEIWRQIAGGLGEGIGRTPLIAYHPQGGRESSSMFLQNETWLSINGMQSGHGGGHDVPEWQWIARDYALEPHKPTLDLEPNYEDHPYNPWPRWDPTTGYFRDYDVRKQVYRSVFAGAAGVSYGHHAVWGFAGPRNNAENYADIDWVNALYRPAGRQMGFLRRLIESRPFFSRIPDQGKAAVSLFSAEKVSELDRFWREMAPVPGRMESTLRFALASALATLVLVIEQPAVGFIAPSLFMLFLVSHDTPFHCFKDLLTLVSFAALGTASALLMVIATGNDPVARVVGVGAFTFLATFFFRASAVPLAPLAFGCLAFMTISRWENQIRAERILRLSLWPIGTLATVAACGTAVDYVFNRSDPLLALQREIKGRCAALERLLQICATHAEVNQIEKQSALVRRYAVSGVGQMHVLLERIAKRNSCDSAELSKLTAVTRMLDRVVLLGAGFALHNNLQAVDPTQLERARQAIVAIREGRLQELNSILGDLPTPLTTELDHIEQTLRHGGTSIEPSASESSQSARSTRAEQPFFKRLLLPDAFTNEDYLMYALKLSVCATICYVFYNAVKWPAIATAIYFTVYFTGLSTTGASNRKILFRVIGSAIGGLILGIGCIVYVFPNIEGITGFLLVIAALGFLGAWISGSSYFGYLGLQITYAFNLLAFERLSAPDQLKPARDRLLGIAIGFVVMFFIFHQVRPERTVDTMKRLLARLLRAAADLIRLFDMEADTSRDAKIAAIRKQIAAVVVNLHSFADVIKYEFPPDRDADMKLSAEIMSAVTSAADVLLGIPTWPPELADEKVTQLKEIRRVFQNGLREMASLLEQIPREQQRVPQETAIEKLPSAIPVAVAKTIDNYRELQMVCAGILRTPA